MSKKDAQKRVNEIEKEISKLVHEATKLADEHGVEFSLSIAYGMGGRYLPSVKNAEKWDEKTRDNLGIEMDEEDGGYRYDNYDLPDGGEWYTSSMSC